MTPILLIPLKFFVPRSIGLIGYLFFFVFFGASVQALSQSSKPSPKIETLSAAKLAFEEELKNYIYNVNVLRTPAEYVELITSGVSDIKERTAIRKRFQEIRSVPRGFYLGNSTILLVQGNQKFKIKVVDFKKSLIAINGAPWKYNPKKSLLSQLDALTKKLQKLKNKRSAATAMFMIEEASALAPLVGIGYGALVVGARVAQAARLYRSTGGIRRVIRLSRKLQKRDKIRNQARGQAKEELTPQQLKKKKKKQKAAKKEKARRDKLKEEDLWLQQMRADNARKVRKQQIVPRLLDRGKTLATGGFSALSLAVAWPAYQRSVSAGTSFWDEIVCEVRRHFPKKCEKMKLEVNTIAIAEPSKRTKSKNSICPSKDSPKYTTVTTVRENGEVVMKVVHILNISNPKNVTLEHHIALPKAELGPGSQQYVMAKRRLDLSTFGLKTPTPAEPIFEIDTSRSRILSYNDQHYLQSVKSIAFKKKRLPLESESASFPFSMSLLPNLSVPETERVQYATERQAWLKNERDPSADGEAVFLDLKKVTDPDNTKAREAWDGFLGIAPALMDSYKSDCGNKGNLAEEVEEDANVVPTSN